MPLPNFPNSPAVNQIAVINQVRWQYRGDGRWHPLVYNGEAYYVTPEMFGAVGNGTADDTTALTEFWNATAKTKMLRPGATYLVTARFTMSGQQDVMVHGNGARLLRNQVDGMYPGQPNNPNTGYVNPGIDNHVLVILNCKNVTIDGLRIRGGYNPASPQTPGINTSYWSNSQTNGRGEDGHGISICQSEDVTIDNCEIVNVWGDCVWVTSGGYLGDSSHTPCRNIQVRNCDLRNPFRGCLSSVHSIGLVFEDNYCEKYTGYTTAILLEPNNNVAQNCIRTTIRRNTVSAGLSGCFAATSSGALLNGEFIHHITISDNYFAGAACIALTSPNTRGVIIENNTYTNSGLLANSAQYGLFLEAFQAYDVSIKGNRDWSGGTSNAYYRGYRLEQCRDVVFSDHTIDPLYDKSSVEYFQFINCNDCTIRDSYIKGRDSSDPNGTGVIGMYGTSSRNKIYNNFIDGTGFSSHGVSYVEQGTFTGTNNEFYKNKIMSSTSSFAVVLRASHFGTIVGENLYLSGRAAN
ncbi:MAG: hypothetical protein ACRCSS_14215, partial [Shewanella sp.]